MEVLREISKLSKYRPTSGAKKELYKLTISGRHSRSEAEKQFENKYRNGQFSIVYKRLKYSLLDGILNAPITNIPKSYINRIRVWKRHLQIKLLFVAGYNIAASKLAIQLINTAEKNNELEIAESICRELMLYFSTSKVDYPKYQKYKVKYQILSKLINDQKKIELLYQELVVSIKTKRPIDFIPSALSEFGIPEDNKYYRFGYYYFLTKSLYFRTVKRELEFIENNKNANLYFSGLEYEVPYLVKYMFFSDLIPHYIFKGKFADSESLVNTCLELPPKGSANWSRILVYQSYLGFYSNKPKIALNAFKKAHSIRLKFNSPTIFERWHIMSGYLAIFTKIGRIVKNDKEFRLKKYLNVDESRENHDQKSNLIIIELLHLLFDNKRSAFFDKLESTEHYIHTRFKAHKFKRTRYFLRMLKAVVKGNYHPILVQEYAKKNFKKLVDTKGDLDVNSLNIEYVPYEILWQEVINFLSKK